MTTTVARLEADHSAQLREFLDRIPDDDVAFIKEDVRDPAVAESWVRRPGRTRIAVAVQETGEIVGLVSVRPLMGWSAHVGELRLVVDPAARGQGVGRKLAMHALREALAAGLGKIVVEVVAEQEGAVRIFTELGFRGEALLSDHIRDRTGVLRDLLVLAHDAADEWSAMASVGVEGEVA